MRALVLAMACFVATGLGVVLAFVPVAGAVFAFGAPALALLGVILGGLELSRLRRENKPRDAALIGTVLSALGFFPALITALTCGVCNALVSGGPIEVQRGVQFHIGRGASQDAGVPLDWPLPARKPRAAGAPSDSPEPSAPSGAGPSAAPSTGHAAPGALPPPPLPAGPGALP